MLRERSELRETEIRRFVREGQLGEHLVHENILRVYKLFEWRDTLVLVLELADTSLTPSHVLISTPLYMAPELIAGRAHSADARCDIYALGVTLYELAAGRPPFTGRTREELWNRVLHDEPPRLIGQSDVLPEGFEAVALRALEKNPAQRQNSAGELAAAIERLAMGLSPTESSTGLLLRRRWRSVLRHRLSIAATTALVLVDTRLFDELAADNAEVAQIIRSACE